MGGTRVGQDKGRVGGTGVGQDKGQGLLLAGRRIKEDREVGLGRKRKPGLKRVGDTELKLKSWVGTGDCRGSGT